MPIGAFQPSTGCGCPAGLAAEWRPSMRAKALSNPLYKYSSPRRTRPRTGQLGPFCNSSHGPIAVMSGQLKGVDQSKLTSASAEGVTWTSATVSPARANRWATSRRRLRTNQVKRAQMRDPPVAHAAAFGEFHKTAEFCGACHEVIRPAVPGLHLGRRAGDWKNSPYAQQGIECPGLSHDAQPGPHRSGAPKGGRHGSRTAWDPLDDVRGGR